jgi:FtsH-binding integral membrane protein
VLALISLATIAAGLVPVWTRRPEPGWLERHGRFMAWSFAGVVAAFLAEISARLPHLGAAFTIGGMLAVMTAAAILIETRLPRLLR